MKTQFKKILNLIKSLKTKTSLSYIALISCLILTFFSLMTSKAAAFFLQPFSSYPNPFEGASTKEILITIVCVVLILAAPEEIKKLIRKHNERKLKKEESFQSNQSPEPEKTTKEQNSKETDENENS